MKAHHLVKCLLTGAISLALIAPLAGNGINPASAATRNWLRITTNRDRLMLNKPGSRRIKYYHHNKGMRIRAVGRFYYHHKRYYRINLKRGRHGHVAYILASETNGAGQSRRMRRHHIRRNNRPKRQRLTRHVHRNRGRRHARHQIKRNRRNNGSNHNTDRISSSHWYVDSNPTSVADLGSFNSQIKNESIADINSDRMNHNKRTLKNKAQLDMIANLRAKQANDHFSHFENGDETFSNAYFEKDAKKLGINPNDISWGENLARTNYGGKPTQIADQMNDGYMNNDANSNWGHRKNILNKAWSYVGVGSYHNNNNNETYQVEDFVGK